MAKYDKFTSLKNPGRPVQVESATRDGSGKNIENNYAKQDGSYSLMDVGKAEVAGNLVATKGLTVNDDPMSYGMVGGAQKSAVGDGNASLNKLVCVDVVRNQLINPDLYINVTTSGYTINGITFTKQADGSILANGTSTGYASTGILTAPDLPLNHKILYIGCPLGGGPDKYGFGFGDLTGSNRDYGTGKMTSGDGNSVGFTFVIAPGITVTNLRIYPMVIDLTKRYGNNDVVDAIIGTNASTQVANLLASDPEILNDTDYDEGTLTPSKTAKLLSVGVNQWDEAMTIGAGINQNTGANDNSKSNWNRLDQFIRVIPNSSIAFYCGKSNVFKNVYFYDKDKNLIRYSSLSYNVNPNIFTIDSNCCFVRFEVSKSEYGTVYNHDICVNVSDTNINGKYYKHTSNPVTLPNYEGHGILKVVDGKVVADGTELYPDGNSKKRYRTYTFTGNELYAAQSYGRVYVSAINSSVKIPSSRNDKANILMSNFIAVGDNNLESNSRQISISSNGAVGFCLTKGTSSDMGDVDALKAEIVGKTIVFELATEEDITTPVFQSTFPVEQGGTLQFLDENDEPIAGLQGSEIFYQKNLKTFVEALGEATNWDPERIKRLGNLSFTPEYVDITLSPSPTGAYARAQVYNATFTIVISAALTGTAGGSITFQDSEVDLTNFQTKPAEAIYDMDGKKVSEAPTTTDCNIASFVGRSKNGIVLWSLLHSGVNKVKIHIEEAVPLDADGNGKIDCRASLIL